MLLRWLPWRFLTSRWARAHGLVDPVGILARLEGLAQPSEVTAPIELLRMGLELHARGILNGKIIQQNLDWVWPFWITRQFNPQDDAFIPRGFSFSQVNLTHRNWTAVGLPDVIAMPLVDPRGLLTPFFDGWSLDAWLVPHAGKPLYPSRADQSQQTLVLDEEPWTVRTDTAGPAGRLRTEARVVEHNGRPFCLMRCEARAEQEPGWLVLSLRPANAEGVGLVHAVELDQDRSGWTVDRLNCIRWDRPASRHACSNYQQGDVAIGLLDRPESTEAQCRVGLPTAAAMFPIKSGEATGLTVTVDLGMDKHASQAAGLKPASWSAALASAATLDTPDATHQKLWNASLRSLVLLTPSDAYPGSYTYKRFWFRDAAFMVAALLAAGLKDRARRVIEAFFPRQHISGYFHSQAGEWDSNGQAIWTIHRYLALTGEPAPADWLDAVEKAARWIMRKRTSDSDELHAGLMPAGFSAEHLGNNDFYYWDDFWSIAGLRCAADLSDGAGRTEPAEQFRREAEALDGAIRQSVASSTSHRDCSGMPASPYRRMDAAAVSVLAACYPLDLRGADDLDMRQTTRYLLDRCMLEDMFYLDISHSGRNAYLTLHLAQVLLRAGDHRCLDLVRATAEAASPTGQWPEAIHPRTGGGCMGDGQHGWASAEWVLWARNAFVCERAEDLLIGRGLPAPWLQPGRTVRFGPTPTPYGPLSLTLRAEETKTIVTADGQWRGAPRAAEIVLAGHEPIHAADILAGPTRVRRSTSAAEGGHTSE